MNEEPTVRLKDSEKITPEEARSRVMEGEELVWAKCPCCGCELAVYIKPKL